MSLLLRSCILIRTKPFIKELTSSKSVFMHYSKYNVKTFAPCLHARNFSTENNECEERQQIYLGRINKQIFFFKIFSISTSIISIVAQPILYYKMMSEPQLGILAGAFVFLNMFTIFCPFFMNYLTKRYVTAIDYSSLDNKYTATIYTFFCKRKKITFTPDDVTIPDSPFRSTLATFYANKAPLLIDEMRFTDRKHYDIILGHNKPVDFELEKVHVTPINQLPPIEKNQQIESTNEKQK